MLIVDFTQIMIANLHAQIGIHHANDLEEGLLKHMILNTIRSIRMKFGSEYGDIVIACDKRTWRKSVYPYYKANRATAKAKSALDWNAIFKVFDVMKSDLKEFFPYRVIEVEGAEADDVIGTLVHEFGMEGLAVGEPILIISADHDFAQLHSYANVKQYDPIKKKYVESKASPRDYLFEQIIKGDSGDGVPNVLSDDDTFVVDGKRQTPMTAKRLAECREKFASGSDDPKYIRNEMMINLRNTPSDIKAAILAEYDAQSGKDRRKIFGYLMTNKMRNLMDAAGDF